MKKTSYMFSMGAPVQRNAETLALNTKMSVPRRNEARKPKKFNFLDSSISREK